MSPSLPVALRSRPALAVLAVGAIILAALPFTGATHLAGQPDFVLDASDSVPAYYDGQYLGMQSRPVLGGNLTVGAGAELHFERVNAMNATQAELRRPDGVVVATSTFTAGHNASTRNVTFILGSSQLDAAGLYGLFATSTGHRGGGVYVAPSQLFVNITPPISPYSPGGRVFTIDVTNSSGPVPGANLTGAVPVQGTTTDPNGRYVFVASPPVGDHVVFAKKDWTIVRSNGVNVPEQEGAAIYRVTQPVATFRIGQHAGSLLPIVAPIRLENVSDFGSATIRMTYDPNVVEVTNVSAGNIPNGTLTWSIDNSTGSLTLLVTTSARPGASGSYDFAKLTLRAVGAAGSNSTLDLGILEAIDSNGTALTASAVDGSFRVGITGDADGDGDVDQDDVRAISDAVVGRRSMASIVAFDADVSHDGVVTGKDAMFVSQYLAGTRPQL